MKSATSAIQRVSVSSDALKVFESQVKSSGRRETGGILLGYVEGDTIFIKKATDAGPKAIKESVYFRADPNYVDMIIDMEYANSGGVNAYLGEWHSHPEVVPSPSVVDLNSLEEIANTSVEFALLVILGAIGYATEKFTSQSTGIIKFRGERNFYRIPIEIPHRS